MSTFNLPDLGEGLAEAEILEWRVKVGDHVRVDQPMVSVETAKAVVEVPAPYGGIVTALHGAPGQIIATGAPLIDFDAGTVVGSMPAASDQELIEPAGNDALRVRRDGIANGVRAAPAARLLGKRLQVDLSVIAGSGRGGLVTVDDVLASAATKHGRGADEPAQQRAAESLFDTGPLRGAEPLRGTEPLRGARRVMARSMSVSRDQVSGSTVCDDADVHAWIQGGDYMPRLMRALVCAWRIEPALNAWFHPQSESRALLDYIDLAVAVDTPGGLIVPVVRNIESKTAQEMRAALAEQKQAAREKRTTPEDLRGFTLMLSNFGTLAGRYAIPLVVPPAVAILGAGKVREEAVVVDGAVRAHRRMPLSLSFDHRCVTGGEACRFLAAAIADLEKPE
jgi:2-oxoisovalerate dehydrogenase E2 component (dihydrolipoyl transacylase)